MFETIIQRSHDEITEQRRAGNYSFNWSQQEKAIDLAIMTIRFESHKLDKSLSGSESSSANLGCNRCAAVVFPDETVVFDVTQHHMGCGGLVEALPF